MENPFGAVKSAMAYAYKDVILFSLRLVQYLEVDLKCHRITVISLWINTLSFSCKSPLSKKKKKKD